jgi:hypothetical protein
MSQSNLIALAESCSALRTAIGRMLLAEAESAERKIALATYGRELRRLLRVAREQECGLYLEVAGELAATD